MPAKPAGGWPILVTPLKAGLQTGEPYVVAPSGAQRALTNDEALYLRHFKREVRFIARPFYYHLVLGLNTCCLTIDSIRTMACTCTCDFRISIWFGRFCLIVAAI